MRISCCNKLTNWWNGGSQDSREAQQEALLVNERPTNHGWRSAVLPVVGSVAALAWRAANFGRVSNALSSVASGALAMISSFKAVPDEQTQAVERISSTVFGQMPVFFLSQLYANTEDPFWQQVATTGIVFCLGAQIVTIGHRLKEDYGIRTETTTPTAVGVKFAPPIIPRQIRPLLKGVASVGFGAGAALWDDTILRMMLAFLSTYYAGHIVGSSASGRIVAKIEVAHANRQETNWPVVKAIADGFCFLVIPLSFFRFTGETFSAAQLPLTGALCGLGQGFLEQPLKERWNQVPIERLTEFEELRVPQGAASRIENCVRRIEEPDSAPEFSKAYKVFETAIDPLVLSGVTAFGLWQVASLSERVDRIAIGAMTLSFLLALGLGRYADSWSQKDRARCQGPIGCEQRIKDGLIRFLANPTIAGLNSMYLLFAGFNALPMDSEALREQTEEYQILNTLFWMLYGFGMGFEHIQARSAKRWPLPRIGYLAFVNAVLTLIRLLTGVVR